MFYAIYTKGHFYKLQPKRPRQSENVAVQVAISRIKDGVLGLIWRKGYCVNIFNPVQTIERTTQVK